MRRQYRHSEHRRVDQRSALLIDAAINAAESHELTPVVQALLAQGINADVVLRVLTQPRERRRYTALDNMSSSLLFH